MKTEEKKTEMKLLQFDEANFIKVKSVLNVLADVINEKPIPSENLRSVRALEQNGYKNDCFVSLCTEAWIILDEELFFSCLKNGVSAIVEQITKDVAPAMKEVVRVSHEPLLKRFTAVFSQFKSRVANENHYIWMQSQRSYQLEKYISFIGGRAVVTPETLENLKAEFRTYVDTESKAKALEVLEEIAYLTGLLKKLQVDKNLIPFALDFNWFMEDPAGKITPNPEIIKYC
jgi:hypothetical protein